MIEWARVNTLRDEVGDEDFIEIAGLFLSEVEETLTALSSISDPGSKADCLHGLKGSALNLGLDDLAKLSGEYEQSPGLTDLERLKTLFALARKELCARFPDLSA